MNQHSAYALDGYSGEELYQLESWLIEMATSLDLARFHNEISDLLDLFQQDDPHVGSWNLAAQWGDFVDACFDLKDRIAFFLRAKGRVSAAEGLGFPKITEKLPFWDNPNDYL